MTFQLQQDHTEKGSSFMFKKRKGLHKMLLHTFLTKMTERYLVSAGPLHQAYMCQTFFVSHLWPNQSLSLREIHTLVINEYPFHKMLENAWIFKTVLTFGSKLILSQRLGKDLRILESYSKDKTVKPQCCLYAILQWSIASLVLRKKFGWQQGQFLKWSVQ